MRVEIKLTGTVEADPAELVEAVLYEAVEHGLTDGRADYSCGRRQGLVVMPGRNQALHHLEASMAADQADEVKIDLRAQEAVDEEDAAPEAQEEIVDEGVATEPETESGEDAAEKAGQAAVLDVAFGSVVAAKLADELDLTKDDFERKRKSGVKGFTVGDVRKIAAAKE